MVDFMNVARIGTRPGLDAKFALIGKNLDKDKPLLAMSVRAPEGTRDEVLMVKRFRNEKVAWTPVRSISEFKEFIANSTPEFRADNLGVWKEKGFWSNLFPSAAPGSVVRDADVQRFGDFLEGLGDGRGRTNYKCDTMSIAQVKNGLDEGNALIMNTSETQIQHGCSIREWQWGPYTKPSANTAF